MAFGEIKAHSQMIHGRLFLIVTGPDGRTKQVVETDNLYVQYGRDIMASAVGLSQGRAGAQWVVPGTAQSAASDDSGLTGEISCAPSRVKACYSHSAGSINWTLKATWVGLSASRSLYQAGIFCSATGTAGDGAAAYLFAKATFAEVAVASQDTLTIKWTFSISIG